MEELKNPDVAETTILNKSSIAENENILDLYPENQQNEGFNSLTKTQEP
jgi:hypothetical protein